MGWTEGTRRRGAFRLRGRSVAVALSALAVACAIAVAPGVYAQATRANARGVSRPPALLQFSELTGYRVTEGQNNVPAKSQEFADAFCPTGDVVVGGGGYAVNKGLEADINSSVPDSDGTAWTVFINNKSSTANTVVAVAICAASSSLESYSVQSGTPVAVAAHDVAEAIVTCPTGTVALGGGATNDGRQTYQALIDSSPDGDNAWQATLTSNGSEGTDGFAAVACATEPAGYTMVHSKTKSNPAGKATTVTAHCPSGTNVLGGGPLNFAPEPYVNLGLTTSLSNLEGWHSAQDNGYSFSEPEYEQAVCADAVPAPS